MGSIWRALIFRLMASLVLYSHRQDTGSNKSSSTDCPPGSANLAPPFFTGRLAKVMECLG